MTQRWTRWTLSAIRLANLEAGFYFFSPATMRAFGDTMRSFRVIHRDGKVFIVRKRPMIDRDGVNHGGVGQIREFDPATGSIGLPIREGDAA
jgi:hypothetical protein